MGRDAWRSDASLSLPSFNPRARMGRDIGYIPYAGHLGVSIHAPVWGATGERMLHVEWKVVSIHAPVWGATQANKARLAQIGVSIHAPVWGATHGYVTEDLTCRFNPRARMGRDAPLTFGREVQGVSIHAPVWGATEGWAVIREELDVSIHAPVWGATAGTQRD